MAQDAAIQTMEQIRDMKSKMDRVTVSSEDAGGQEGDAPPVGDSPQVDTLPPIARPAPTATATPAPETDSTESMRRPFGDAARPITENVVDRERLADNLFGFAEYRLALEVYFELSQEEVSRENSTWYTYQIASCLRHLGELDQAEKYYRRVAAEQQPEFLSQTSRWWLSVIDDQRKLNEQLEQWKQKLDALEAADE